MGRQFQLNRLGWGAVAAWCTAVLTFTGANAKTGEQCAGPADYLAISARHVQTELMVAALSCDAVERYNSFMKKFQPQLLTSNRQLRQFFERRFGSEGGIRTNEFVTQIANQSSERSLDHITDFCTAATQWFDKADDIKRTEFNDFILAHAQVMPPRVTVCPDTMTQLTARKPKKSPQS
jgi:hypothetical protein